MAALSQYQHQFIVDGLPAALHLLDVFVSGTATRASIYKDAALTVAHTNPVTLTISGQPPGGTLFAASGAVLDFVLRTPATEGGAATGQAWSGISVVPPPSATNFLPLAGGTMTGPIGLAADATAPLNPTTLQQVEQLIAAAVNNATSSLAGQVPIGTVIEWLFDTPPTGWLLLNGAAVSRTAYVALYALHQAAGFPFGAGDGSTTFNVQDRRGYFVRGRDATALRDPDGVSRGTAAVQDFAIQNIVGTFGIDDRSLNFPPTGPFAAQGAATPDCGAQGNDIGRIMSFDTSRIVGYKTAVETRPINVPTQWIIKAL